MSASRLIRMMWLVAVRLMPGCLALPAQPADLPAQARARNLPAVLGVERAEDKDILLLRNGEKLTGTLLNDSFALRASYGQLKFDRRLVAGIDGAGTRQGIESIVTVNNNRFSGFLDDSVFVLVQPTGSRIEVRPEKVLNVVLRLRDGETAGIPQRQFVLLKNGDYFTGKVLVDALEIATTNATVKVPLADAESVSFLGDKKPSARIVLRNGTVLNGTLGAEDIAIQLDLGWQCRIYRDRIDAIYCREGYVPNSQKAALPVARNPGGRNVEGMVWIPAGEFTMGSPASETDRDFDEGPLTKVAISQGFWMGKYEVTQREYEAVMGANPSLYSGDPTRPVEKVSWQDAMNYCSKLTQLQQASAELPEGYVYRLPTEAEWEYACRAGTTTRFSYGDDPGYFQLGDYAWYYGNSDATTHPVGGKKPNAWGLYDMHGNVWEWCLDNWAGSFVGGIVTNRAVLPEGTLRVARGGSWLYDPKFCRSANRDNYGASNRCSDLGFRVVLVPGSPSPDPR
jgi:formylglycine-generating enzyme required for sulfatase activity